MLKSKWLLSLALLLGSSTASALEPAQVLVCYTAGPIDTAVAEQAMGDIMKVVERLGSLPAGSFTTKFVSNMADCYAALASNPHYLFPSNELYLSKLSELGLNPLVKPYIANLPADTYYVIVKKDTFKNLEELKGKKMGGAVLGEPEFIKRIVFENKIDCKNYFELIETPRPVKALRDLTKGKLDAVLVNAQQYNAMKELPFFGDLAVAYTSPKIPQLGVVSSKFAQPEVAAKMKTALEKLCSDGDGKSLCKVFGVDNFVSASRSDYKEVEQKYAAGK